MRKMIRGIETECMLFLFNDALLLAESLLRGEELKFIAMISLFEAQLKTFGSVPIPAQMRDDANRFSIKLNHHHHHHRKEFIILISTCLHYASCSLW